MNKVIITNEEYQKLLDEHQLLAILRAYGIEEWQFWGKCLDKLEEEKKNGYR